MYGTIERNGYGPTSAIGKVDVSSTGNIILRVGQQDSFTGPRQQTEHVVLTPDEARGLITEIESILDQKGGI